MITWRFKKIESENGTITAGGTLYECTGDTVTLGRSPDSSIQIDSSGVSRTHSQFSLRDGKVMLIDRGSTNGTWYIHNDTWKKIKAAVVISPLSYIRIAENVVIQFLSVQQAELDNDVSNTTIEYLNATSLTFTGSDLAQREKTLAIMVLDLCASTSTSYSQGDLMGYHIKTRLHDIAMPYFQKYKVSFCKNTGDGFLTTFTSAQEAYDASVAILKALDARNKSTTNPPINIRFGLHFGKVYQIGESGGDLHGNDVNLAFRIESVQQESLLVYHDFSQKDKAVCTKAFLDLLTPRPSFFELGKAVLKGVPDPVELYLLNK